jgi:hypothetical protein
MPEVFVDDTNFELYRQCEIRRPSEEKILLGMRFPAGYYFDIIWIKSDIAKKNNVIVDEHGNTWTIAEVYGAKKMPSQRIGFKQK